MTQTRPIRSALNELQNADVGTSVKYQVCSVHTRPVYTTGTTGTGHIGMSGTATIPVPATLACSAWHHYRYRTLRYVGYDIHTDTVHFGKFDTIWIPVPDKSVNDGTGHFGVFGSTSIPAPDTSVSMVQHQDRYRTHHQVWYNTKTRTGHFGKLGTTPTPVPDTPVSSVRHPYRYRAYRWRTEHALDIVSRYEMLNDNLKTMTT